MGEAQGRCFYCNKRVGLMTIKCLCCENAFCISHRLPEDHACTSDYRGIAHQKHAEKIEKEVVIESSKHNKL